MCRTSGSARGIAARFGARLRRTIVCNGCGRPKVEVKHMIAGYHEVTTVGSAVLCADRLELMDTILADYESRKS